MFPTDLFEPLFGRDDQLSRIAALWLGPRGVLSVWGGVGVGKSALARAAEQMLLEKVARPPAYRLHFRIRCKRGEARRLLTALHDALKGLGLIDRDAVGDEPEARAARIVAALRSRPALVVLDGLEALQHPPHIRGGRLRNPLLARMFEALAGDEAPSASMILALGRQALTEAPDSRRMRLRPLGTEHGAALLRAERLAGGPEELAEAARALEGCPLCLKRAARMIRRETPAGSPPRAACQDRIAPDRLLSDEDGPIDYEARRAAATLAVDLERVERLPRRAAGRGGPERALMAMASLAPEGLGPRELAALLEDPPIPGMTEALLLLGPRAREARLDYAMRRLAGLGLVELLDEPEQDAPEQDAPEGAGSGPFAHRRLKAPPLVRAAARARLQAIAPDALRIAERRLFHAGRSGAASHPACREDLLPVAAAIPHGAAGARGTGALSKVFRTQLWDRLLRGERRFAIARLGAFDPVATALAAFFEARWTRPDPDLEPIDQARALSVAGFALRGRSRLRESAAAQGAAAQLYGQLGRRDDAARAHTERAEALIQLGDLERAREAAEAAFALAEFGERASDRRVTALSALAAVEIADGGAAAAARRLRQAESAQAALVEEGVSDRRRLYSLAGRRAVQALLAERRLSEAESRARSIEAAALEDGYPYAIGLARLSLAEIAAARLETDPRQAIPEARAEFEASIAALEAAGRIDALPEALLLRGRFLGRLAARRGGERDLEAARRDFERALRLAETAEMAPAARLAREALAESDARRAGRAVALRARGG